MNHATPRVHILSVPDFRNLYGTARHCLDALRRIRWPDGFVCPACGGRDAVWLERRELYQCSACRRQTSVTAGTLFHKSRIELHKWFWAIYRLAQDKKGYSAMLLSKEIDVCYPTAWLMAHKIRHAMTCDDTRTILQNLVELDEAVLEGAPTGRSGHGPRRKAPLLVAVERRPDGRLGHAAIEPVPQLRRRRASEFAEMHVSHEAQILSNGGDTFAGLVELGYPHVKEFMSTSWAASETAGSENDRAARVGSSPRRLRATRLVISNLKRFIFGRHHGTAPKHAVRYVGEFVCRFNHRDTEATLFQQVLELAARVRAITYPQLIAAELR